jgi:hypothetical protein
LKKQLIIVVRIVLPIFILIMIYVLKEV